MEASAPVNGMAAPIVMSPAGSPPLLLDPAVLEAGGWAALVLEVAFAQLVRPSATTTALSAKAARTVLCRPAGSLRIADPFVRHGAVEHKALIPDTRSVWPNEGANRR
jgi:hypothetical protein